MNEFAVTLYYTEFHNELVFLCFITEFIGKAPSEESGDTSGETCQLLKEDELKNILQGRDPDYSVFSLCGDKNDDTESSEAVEICNGE